MRGVSKWLGGVAAIWAVALTVGVFAQAAAPARPAAVPAEAKKMKAAFPSSPAAIEAGKVLFAKYCRFCHGNTGAGDSTMAPKDMKPSNLMLASDGTLKLLNKYPTGKGSNWVEIVATE